MSGNCRRASEGGGGGVGCEGILECSFEVALSLSLAPRSDEGKVFKATRPRETGVFELASALALSCGCVTLRSKQPAEEKEARKASFAISVELSERCKDGRAVLSLSRGVAVADSIRLLQQAALITVDEAQIDGCCRFSNCWVNYRGLECLCEFKKSSFVQNVPEGSSSHSSLNEHRRLYRQSAAVPGFPDRRV